MILCICRRINETSARDAVRSGARSPEAVQAAHGCAFNCGKCRPAIAEVIHDELGIGCADSCPVCAVPIGSPDALPLPAEQVA